jgi:hypothetical protein
MGSPTAKPLSLLEQLIVIVTNPKEELDTRDGFFCSYRLTVCRVSF